MLRMPTMKGGKTLLQYLFALTRGHGKLEQVKFYAPTGLRQDRLICGWSVMIAKRKISTTTDLTEMKCIEFSAAWVLWLNEVIKLTIRLPYGRKEQSTLRKKLALTAQWLIRDLSTQIALAV